MKKIIIAAIILILIAGLIGGTFAMFSDTESTVDNNFTAGILDIDDSGIGTADISEDIVAPGTQYENDITVAMEANSNMTAARTELDFDADNYLNGATEWAATTSCDTLTEYMDNVFVTKLTMGGDSLFGASDNLGTAAVPVALADCTIAMDADWDGVGGNDSVKLSTLVGKLLYITGDPGNLEFDWGIPATVNDNAVQGDNCDLDIIVAVAQDVSQASIVSD